MTEKEKIARKSEANVLRIKALLIEHPELTKEAERMTVQLMTREQVEYFMMEHLKEIRDLLRYYSPDSVFLSLFINDGYLSISGSVDAKNPLECHVDLDSRPTKGGTDGAEDEAGREVQQAKVPAY